MEYGIWNIHGGLWTTNPVAYNNTSAVYTNRLAQFPFQNTTIATIPENFKTVPSTSDIIENDDQQSESETNDSSEHSNTSQTQKETQTEPDADDDNASDFISNFGLNNIKIENSLAFINQQLNPVYNLMLNHLSQRQEIESNSDNEDDTKTVETEDLDKGENKDLFECSVCQATLKSNEDLQRHLEIKHFNNEVIVSTRPCTQTEINDRRNYSDNSNSSLKRQERLSLQRVRYEREEYRCTLCTYTCTIEKAFYRHLRAHSSNLNESESNPVPRISCVICGKDRSSENDMIRHMQKHKDNRHFCCDICVFRTVQLKKLIQHRRMHTGEKPHLCPHCIYRSARRDNLRSHVRRVHKKDNLFCDTFSPRGLLLTSKARNINADKF